MEPELCAILRAYDEEVRRIEAGERDDYAAAWALAHRRRNPCRYDVASKVVRFMLDRDDFKHLSLENRNFVQFCARTMKRCAGSRRARGTTMQQRGSAVVADAFSCTPTAEPLQV
jgi:hypothetical protein